MRRWGIFGSWSISRLAFPVGKHVGYQLSATCLLYRGLALVSYVKVSSMEWVLYRRALPGPCALRGPGAAW